MIQLWAVPYFYPVNHSQMRAALRKGHFMKDNQLLNDTFPEVDTELRQLVFHLMNGSFNLEDFPVPESKYVMNEYAEGQKCSLLYGEAYRIKQNLSSRLNSPEDPEVERLMDLLLDIGEHMSMKMFDYGWFFAKIRFHKQPKRPSIITRLPPFKYFLISTIYEKQQ